MQTLARTLTLVLSCLVAALVVAGCAAPEEKDGEDEEGTFDCGESGSCKESEYCIVVARSDDPFQGGEIEEVSAECHPIPDECADSDEECDCIDDDIVAAEAQCETSTQSCTAANVGGSKSLVVDCYLPLND